MRERLLFVVLVVLGCEPLEPEPCTLEARAGIQVTIEDADGAAICDGTVNARDGEFDEQLEPTPDCGYAGVFERPGTYSVRAEAAGLTPVEREVVVDEDECHVITEEVAIALDVACPDEPNPGLEVIVRDPDGGPLCNVTVTAVDGDYREELQRLQLGPGNCRFVGAFERPATYALEVDANEPFVDVTTAQEHIVEEDSCGVVQRDVGIFLERDQDPCPPVISPMFNISLEIEGSGDPLCDAQMIARDGSTSITLLPSDCIYQDLGDNRPGTYSIEIVRADFISRTIDEVVVSQDTTGCTVETVRQTYTLTPAP